MKSSGFCRIMVKVNCICFVVALFVRGAVSRAQDTTEFPTYVSANYLETGSARDYPYATTNDYRTMYGGSTKPYIDYRSPYDDYTAYDENLELDIYEEYDDYNDISTPKVAVQEINPDTGVSNVPEMPWVYIIVPVVQIDVYYVDDEKKSPEDMEIQLPIETFFFELGNFGMGHVDLLDFGLSELDFAQDSFDDYFQYDDYPTMGHYPNSNIYDTADQLSDWATLDYPGIDHEPYWLDWIFMMPPAEMNPIV
ncbi:uncharacterized protein LOC124357122 isoform X2 [Homalodisca vitripennis]|uniref:uncharacterized protein LOC124357122 isoform X2 n=1 Tax=Homalodisca vitripennis TaxID=197043 RepID=UPI001EEB3355|nr:uncharacterized protein LOC124357122 isoform X2 [Homalodisca vitripennis]